MSFSELYGAVLSPFVKKFKLAKNENEKKAIVKSASAAVSSKKELLEEGGDDLPEDLQAVITRYIKGAIKKGSNEENADLNPEPKPKKVKQVYQLRDVIKQHYRSRVEEEIPFKSSDKRYLGSYQAAVTKVLENMTEEDLEEANNIVESWNKDGGPSEVQMKRAKAKLPKEIQKKVEDWKFTSGALVMCMVAYSDGKDVQTFHVESSPFVGINSFTTSCKEWKEGTYESFKDWSLKQFGLKENDSDEEAEVQLQFMKSREIPFKKNKNGDYILPENENFKTNKQKQRMVRGYVGTVYREFTGNARAAFPYLLASKDDQTIFSLDSVPKDFSLSDPDHLSSTQIDLLYSHWVSRQRKGLTPFVILNSIRQHGKAEKKSQKSKGKKKAEWVDVGSGDEDAAEEDGPNSFQGEETSDAADMEDAARQLTERDDVEEELQPVKRGPPKKRGKKALGLTGDEEDPSTIAGPSTIPLLEKGSKKNQAKDKKEGKVLPEVLIEGPVTRKAAKKPQVQKRKLEEEEEDAGTPKKRGRKSAKKVEDVQVDVDGSKREKGKKRKVVNDQETAPKAKRAKMEESPPKPKPGGKGESSRNRRSQSPKKSKVVSKQRDTSRVKPIPSGNSATSSSRKAFLRNICQLSKFHSLVDLIQPFPKASEKPKEYPSWASWNSKEEYLPASFHTESSFKSCISILKKNLGDSSISEGRKVEAPLLLLGLLYQEVSRAMEAEPGEPSPFPPHLINSPFGVEELTEIEELVNGFHISC